MKIYYEYIIVNNSLLSKVILNNMDNNYKIIKTDLLKNKN